MTAARTGVVDGPTLAGIERFERDGYLRVGPVLPRLLCAPLRAELEAEAATRHATSESALSEDRFERLAPDGTLVLTVLLDHAARRLGAVAEKIAGWAAALLDGPAVELLSDETFVKPAGHGDEVDWHQDWIVYPQSVPHFVTCWLALDDMTVGNGALEIGVGTHLLGPHAPAGHPGSVPDARLAGAFVGLPAMSTPQAMGLRTEVLTLQAGEASFHHALTWHRSGPNRDGAGRTAVVLRHRPRW